MSAIAGFWSFDGATAAEETCARMLQELRPYGGKGLRQFSGDRLAMGCCLSRLLPEDSSDSQPLSSEGVSALVADVRLDNRSELIRRLNVRNSAGVPDSEILLAAWHAWGESCVEQLTGAFSFAVWNSRKQHLFVARDPVGERPLYYFSGENCFAFASMPKGMYTLPFIGAEIDEDYIAHYLALAPIPVEQTIFRRIIRLPAGSSLSIQPGKLQIRKYWHPEQLPELRLKSDEEYLELFRERFDDAVRARLRTVGKVGAQLSGGLDSSAVAATAARLLSSDGRDVTAFTAVPRSDFQDANTPNYFEDEGPAAAEVAAVHQNLRHVLVDSSQGSFLDILDLSSSLYDHPPFAPTHEVWLHAILKQAKERGITVLLNGNCGNSTISSYGMSAFSEWFRTGQWGKLTRVAWQVKQGGDASAKTILRNTVWPSLPFWLRRMTDPHIRHSSFDYCALHPDIVRRLDITRKVLHSQRTDQRGGRALLSTMLKDGDVGENGISAEGGWQMDFRDPTYDSRIVELCMTLPLEQFLRDGRLRSLVRRAMVDRLPASTLARRQRGRQSADWYLTMGSVRGRMLSEVDSLESSPLASRMLDLARMRRLIENWPASGFERNDIRSTYHIALSRGFSVGRFLRRFDPQVSS